MTILRRHHNSNFTIVPNAVFEDKRLSVEAKGTLGWLLSRPHNWMVRLANVAQTLGMGRDKAQRIFNELIDAGYVSRDQVRTASQQWASIEYVVFDQPVACDRSQSEAVNFPRPDFPCPFEPQPDLPYAAGPRAESTVAYKGLTDNKMDSNKDADDARAREPSRSFISPEAFTLCADLMRLQQLDQDDPRCIGAAYQVQAWLTKGWLPELIHQAVEIVMARCLKAPRSLRYFEQAIADAHAERDRPLPVAANGSIAGNDGRRRKYATGRNGGGFALIATKFPRRAAGE